MESDSLQDHLLKIKDIRDQLKSTERIMEERDIVVHYISLPSSYANFIETLNITKNNKS